MSLTQDDMLDGGDNFPISYLGAIDINFWPEGTFICLFKCRNTFVDFGRKRQLFAFFLNKLLLIVSTEVFFTVKKEAHEGEV